MKITVTEAYADQFLCGAPVLLGRFDPIEIYPTDTFVRGTLAPAPWPSLEEIQRTIGSVRTAPRIYEIATLAVPSECRTTINFRSVVRLKPCDDVSGLRGWRAVYHG